MSVLFDSFSDSDYEDLSFFNDYSSLQDDKHLKMFEGLDKFEEEKMKVLKETGNKTNKQKLMKAFTPTPGMRDKWVASIEGKDFEIEHDRKLMNESFSRCGYCENFGA